MHVRHNRFEKRLEDASALIFHTWLNVSRRIRRYRWGLEHPPQKVFFFSSNIEARIFWLLRAHFQHRTAQNGSKWLIAVLKHGGQFGGSSIYSIVPRKYRSEHWTKEEVDQRVNCASQNDGLSEIGLFLRQGQHRHMGGKKYLNTHSILHDMSPLKWSGLNSWHNSCKSR